uniref:Growth factor receptor-bound protein 10-like n=1 Tax=Echeneis naucrates TaxID=173247 RepID=A0A665TMF9_ECHNA
MVNEMNSSMESVYSSQADTALLLNNGHAHRHHTPPLPTASPSRDRLRHSQPMHIQAVRCLQEEQQLRPASLPAIPNPFPELCSPAGSPVLNPIQTSDNHVSMLPLPHQTCHNFLLSFSCLLLPARENVTFTALIGIYSHHYSRVHLQIVKVWSEDGAGKVVEIPADMTARDVCQLLVYKSHCLDDNAWTLVEHHPILGLERCLEDHELVVQVQASMSSDSKFLFRKNYAKYEFFRNPLEPRHLQLLSDLEDSNVFTIITGRKLHNAPTDYQFCIKPSKVRSDCKELKMLCAEDEQSRTCWMTAFRLLKYGIVLYQSYNIPQQRKTNLSPFSAPVRSVSENSLVAMDFSGRTGRVIDNPVEAQSAALEEGQTWRKRSQRMNVLGSPSPLHPSSLSTVIHRTQVWFHGRIMREEAHKMIIQQGQVDGLFLLRDSQSNPKAFVLTLCHHQKIKHFQILPCEEDGQVFFSLDDGATKFTDLIHLVEFYQLNRGVLPCKLKHPCTAVAL